MSTAVAGDDEILTELRGGVRIITLNRPKARNALTATMVVSYAAALRAAEEDPRVRVIVITGAGAGFCSGADLTVLGEGPAAIRAFAPAAEDLPTLALRLRKPVIAAVNGAAVGIGFAYMLCSDIRIAAESARFATAFSRLGLAAEYGVSWLLPRLIGVQPAMDLLLSGRMVDAREALAAGLVQRVVPDGELLATAVGYAADLAEHCSPFSLATIKEQVYGDLDRSHADALVNTRERMRAAHEGAALAEAMAARAQKRAPVFEPLPAPRRD